MTLAHRASPTTPLAERRARPPRGRQIGVGHVEIGAKEREYVMNVLDSGRLSYGPYSERFEREFARIHGRKFALFCNSGTSALQVGLHAMKEHYGWQDGDEVLVPALTFVASVNVVIQNRLRPVFVDVDPLYYEMDPTRIAARVTGRTRAVMPVHVFGQPCDMDPMVEQARASGLRIIEDSCETMFASYKGRPVGSWGDVACFSTYAAHLLVTGVGGLALTDDPALAVLNKSLANHGRDGIYLQMDDDDVADPAQLLRIVERRFSFEHVGYSYRATELEAAIGLAQLERWRDLVAVRQARAACLSAQLAPLREHLQLPAIRPRTDHVFMMYPIVVRHGGRVRDQLIAHLEERGIETRYMLPLTNQPVYRRLFGEIEDEHPVAKRINRRGFYIGCHPGMTDADIEYVVSAFHEFFSG